MPGSKLDKEPHHTYFPLTAKMLLKKASEAPVKSMLAIGVPA
jgi:hypothetical protein